ncbi:MAG: hypothetical protein M0Q92_12590 [Methanoregula sp.]|nr:hypothetical protein [Methanoregula sp.]
MTIIYNKSRQTAKRKYLRNHATDAEKLLWTASATTSLISAVRAKRL